MNSTVTCPNCGFNKTMPDHLIPPLGTPATCPGCARTFHLSGQTVLPQADGAQETLAADRPRPPVETAVRFNTFTKRDNRFIGKGKLRITHGQLTVEGRRNRLFSRKLATETYSLDSVRNVRRDGKVVRFVVPLSKGRWDALIVCADQAAAVQLTSALPDQTDSTYYTMEQANQELQERISRLPEGSPVTWSLMALNILVYLAVAYTGKQWLSFNADYLAAAGGNFSPLTTEGEWWRMLTATVLHGGLIHLLLNMYALYSFGCMAERLYSSRVFLTIYLMAGLCGSAGTLLFSPAAVGVGASGAIFGIMGAMIAFLVTDKTFLSQGARRQLLINFCIFGGYSLLQGFRHSGIDNAAHIGGLLTGLILGWLTGVPLRLRNLGTGWLNGRVTAGILLVLAATGAAAASSPRLGGDYKVHLAMIQMVRELAEKETKLTTYVKEITTAGKTRQITADDMQEFARRMQDTYASFPQRLEHLRPESQGLKTRKTLLYTYTKQKADAAALYQQSVNTNDKSLSEEATGKVKAANELIKEMTKPFSWHQ